MSQSSEKQSEKEYEDNKMNREGGQSADDTSEDERDNKGGKGK